MNRWPQWGLNRGQENISCRINLHVHMYRTVIYTLHAVHVLVVPGTQQNCIPVPTCNEKVLWSILQVFILKFIKCTWLSTGYNHYFIFYYYLKHTSCTCLACTCTTYTYMCTCTYIRLTIHVCPCPCMYVCMYVVCAACYVMSYFIFALCYAILRGMHACTCVRAYVAAL